MILDVGCGVRPTGDINIDVEKTLIKSWKAIKKFNSTIELVLADAHYLPFRAKVFSGVNSFSVLPYVKNEKLVIKEVNRVLKCDGLVLITHNMFTFYLKALKMNSFKLIARAFRNMAWRIFFYAFKSNVQTPIVYTFQTCKGLKKLLEKEGFTVLELYQERDVLKAKAMKTRCN